MAVLGLCCCVGLFLVALSSGYCLVVLHGLLIAMASLVAEDGLAGEGRGSFHSCDTWAR